VDLTPDERRRLAAALGTTSDAADYESRLELFKELARDSQRRQQAPSSVHGWGSTQPKTLLLSSPRSSERSSVET
jgi:hypothetical protein